MKHITIGETASLRAFVLLTRNLNVYSLPYGEFIDALHAKLQEVCYVTVKVGEGFNLFYVGND